jgi:hypothetical protein
MVPWRLARKLKFAAQIMYRIRGPFSGALRVSFADDGALILTRDAMAGRLRKKTPIRGTAAPADDGDFPAPSDDEESDTYI